MNDKELGVIDELNHRLQDVLEIAECLGRDVTEKRCRYYGMSQKDGDKSTAVSGGVISDIYVKIDMIAEIIVSATKYVKEL